MAAGLAKQYRSGQPFPRVVIDDFLPADVLDRVVAAYPKPGGVDWQSIDTANQKKLGFASAEALPPAVRGVLHFLNAAPVLQFVEKLTGIDGVIPDPYYQGGGLHQIEPGGRLSIHTDFAAHPNLRIERRLNLILYLNKD